MCWRYFISIYCPFFPSPCFSYVLCHCCTRLWFHFGVLCVLDSCTVAQVSLFHLVATWSLSPEPPLPQLQLPEYVTILTIHYLYSPCIILTMHYTRHPLYPPSNTLNIPYTHRALYMYDYNICILTMHFARHPLYSSITILTIHYTPHHALYSPCTVLTMHYARHKLCSRCTILTMQYTDHVLCSPPCKSTMSPAEKLSKKMRKFFWQTAVRRR